MVKSSVLKIVLLFLNEKVLKPFVSYISLVGESSGYHWAATSPPQKNGTNKHLSKFLFLCENRIGDFRETSLEQPPTYLQHIDNMVWEPENAKCHHYGQDEFLTVDLSLELGLPQASQDEHIAHYNDSIRNNESWYCLKGVLKPHLHKDTKQVLSNGIREAQWINKHLL